MNRNDRPAPLSVSVVAGDQNRAIYICETLRDRGLDANAADFAASSDVILFDLYSCPARLASEMADHAAAAPGKRPLTASLGFNEDGSPAPDVDIRFSSDAALAAAPARFEFANRAAARRAEAALREETLATFGCRFSAAADETPRRVLFVGDAGALFPTLKSGLDSAGYTLVAAFSTYSAFDFLHDDAFAAVIVDGGAEWMRPGAFCAMVRRSPALAELPIAAILPTTSTPDEDVMHNATDMIEQDAPAALMAQQIANLIETSGAPHRVVSKPNGAAADSLETLFSRDFFEAHLSRQIDWSETFGQSLTLTAFRIRYRRDIDADADVAHAAHVVTSLLRAQDVPARLDASIIGVSMPGASVGGASGAARRIAGVLDATAFEGAAGPAVQIGLDWRIVEHRTGQSVEEYLRAAIEGGPFERGAAAA